MAERGLKDGSLLAALCDQALDTILELLPRYKSLVHKGRRENRA